jgi:hypothetical protein
MPSAVEGAARLLDFANTITEYNVTELGSPDTRAAYQDWRAVGDDIAEAMVTYSQEQLAL